MVRKSRPASWIYWGTAAGGLAVAACCLMGCDTSQSAEALPEWTPRDHHSRDEDKGRAAVAPSASAQPDPGVELAQLVEFAWRQQCAQCHGQTGKGDGPSGPLVAAPDLTSDEWQAKASDVHIANVIRSGSGKMPKFDLLPDVVVRGLVLRIRSTRGR
ncbi:MAG: cytochrome c [Polyangiaceae bacterium]